MMATQAQVNEALNNAAANGYEELLGMPAKVIAEDLIAYSSDFEDCEVASLIPLVTTWIENIE